jgi:hypothetical protein
MMVAREAFRQRLSHKKGLNLRPFFVPGVGLEPTHLAAADFESAASTDFATRASGAAILHHSLQFSAQLFLFATDFGQ